MQLKFKTNDSIFTVVSSAYYVPEAKARLISPQRLFNSKNGVSEKTIVEDKHSTLVFDSVGEVQIDYDSGSRLHVALAKDKIPGESKVHLAGVLNGDNLIFSFQNLLLH